MKYRFKLSGLDCPNCALKIEEKLKKDKRINYASVNFSKLMVTVETDNESAKKIVTDIVVDVEPNVKVLDLNENQQTKNELKFHIIRLVLGTIFSLVGTFVLNGTISNIFVITGYVILLYRTFKNAVKLLFKSKTINENILVTISCVGAYLTNNVHEGLMVIILYEIGKILEEVAVNNSRKSISALMDIKPEYANLKNNGIINVTSPELVKKGDVIVVKQGEKVPLDGVVINGFASLNMVALTGESKLRKVKVNDEVLSGSINENGFLEIKTTSLYSDSTVSRILELTQNASDRKAKTETFVAKAAKIYTPIILFLAVIIVFVLPLFSVSLSDSIYRALVFLVVSCPCAIAISVPLSYFSGIGKASKNGILIKGSDYLDSLSSINKIIFDKTGTITTGVASDYKLEILNDKYDKKDVINYYVKGEVLSNHPVASSIVRIFNKKVTTVDVVNFKEFKGKGISYELKNNKIIIGSCKFVGVKSSDNAIYLSVNDEVIAKLVLYDGIKKDSKKAISLLKKRGIETLMFTGDDEAIAKDVAKKVGIDKYVSQMLPIDKYNALEKEINENNGKIAFVGDGINDAPSLALADVGISMGGVGSSSAIEASDVVIMTDELTKIPEAINISKKTKRIIIQNLTFAIGVKVLVLILSALGIASMWQAVFADTGVTLITILNTTRILKK